MNDAIATLLFVNRSAETKDTLRVDRAAISKIMDWYGAFHAGDDYSVFINGVEQTLGINGELEPVVIDGSCQPTTFMEIEFKTDVRIPPYEVHFVHPRMQTQRFKIESDYNGPSDWLPLPSHTEGGNEILSKITRDMILGVGSPADFVFAETDQTPWMTMDKMTLKEIEELAETLSVTDPQYDCEADIRTILDRSEAAIRQLLADRQWRLIDTAPKDGTPVDLWITPPKGMITGTGPGRCPDCWYSSGKWWRYDEQYGDDQCRSEVHNATHWLPLPSPNTEEER